MPQWSAANGQFKISWLCRKPVRSGCNWFGPVVLKIEI